MEKTDAIEMEINRKELIDTLLCKEEPSMMEDTGGSPVRGGAPGEDRSDTRRETQKNDMRCD